MGRLATLRPFDIRFLFFWPTAAKFIDRIQVMINQLNRDFRWVSGNVILQIGNENHANM